MKKVYLSVYIMMCAAVFADQPRFTLLQPRLNGVSSLTNCTATDITNDGIVIGSCDDPSGRTRGWVFNGRQFREITVPQSFDPNFNGDPTTDYPFRRDNGVTLKGINKDRVITGWVVSPTKIGADFASFVRTPSGISRIEVPGSLQTEVTGINDTGVIVGDYKAANGSYYGFKLINGVYTSFTVPWSTMTSANDINNKGEIVGITGSTNIGFKIDDTGMHQVTVPGAALLSVAGINDDDTIVGIYATDLALSNTHGFVMVGSTILNLDVPGAMITSPFSINNNGRVVGYAAMLKADGTCCENRAFVTN